MDDVLIVGAGAVGVNAAIVLSKLGFDVRLIDSADDILQGAPRATLINHGDGFEYYKQGHRRTGQYCVDGSIVKGLLYPLQAFATRVCRDDAPIRFLLARQSEGCGELTLERFAENAERMRDHFTAQFAKVMEVRSWTIEETALRLGRRPDTFARRLTENDLADVADVVGGYAGSSFGINMPQYYAFLKSLLETQSIQFSSNSEPTAIDRVAGGYRVDTSSGAFSGRQVLLTSGHHIPLLISRVRGATVRPALRGRYYLNAMTFLRLPATHNHALISAVSRINFTLQQEHGAMFACIVPPTPDHEGFGAVYYPSGAGSQLGEHVFDSTSPAPPPAEWDLLLTEGPDEDDPQVRATVMQAGRIYPFLNDYARVSHTVCRTVFNVDTIDSDNGKDRRVREIAPNATKVTEDGRVTAWSAPKWTNAELVALMAVDHVLKTFRSTVLPKDAEAGFGPSRLDAPEIAARVNFMDATMRLADAQHYARLQRAPDRIVDHELRWFNQAIAD